MVKHIFINTVMDDSVTGERLVIEQAEHIKLKEVTVDGKKLDGSFSKLDTTQTVPHQI
ncbi:MAG: hypothetical protein U5R06_21535 [candidate division KSB1 bacterium]|nr:hypothetical protein [candidate division KSB1 bacterium]